VGAAAAALLSMLLGLVGLTGTAGAASNGLWSVVPSLEPGHPSRVFVKPTLIPGQPYADSVTVANFTSAPLTFNLYAADAFNIAGGGLSLRRPTDPQLGIGAWTTLATDRITVPARQQVDVPFTITPPANATPGDHVGGIVAEDVQGTQSGQGSIPVTVLQAVAVRVYGRVQGPLHPALSVRHLSLHVGRSVSSTFGGSVPARVNFTVTNSGNTVLTPRAVATLTSTFGRPSHRTEAIGQLLPGFSATVAMSFGQVEAYAHLKVTAAALSGQTRTQHSVGAWVPPWGLAAVVGVFVVLLVTLLWRGRRRRARARAPTP